MKMLVHFFLKMDIYFSLVNIHAILTSETISFLEWHILFLDRNMFFLTRTFEK
jgi:hypothetical protein